ncbi:MAG TPA: TetR/AcrR family transcriptional regulator [Caulobacteraceae bacterium]
MPADSSATKARILAAGERLFAESGFEAVSLRGVAREADVQIALVHYHFGSKEGLYKAVWAQRYAGLADLRQARLPTVDFDRERVAVLRDLVDLFVTPLMAGPDAHRFLKIMAHEYADPREPERGVVKAYIDPVTRQLLDAFRKALPGLADADVGWGYQAMTGALMMNVVDVDRATRLTGGAARSGDTKAALPALREFIVGGWLALADRRQAGGSAQDAAEGETRQALPE